MSHKDLAALYQSGAIHDFVSGRLGGSQPDHVEDTVQDTFVSLLLAEQRGTSEPDPIMVASGRVKNAYRDRRTGDVSWEVLRAAELSYVAPEEREW